MAAKQIVFSEEARRKLKNGMTVVANAVSATLGPKAVSFTHLTLPTSDLV